MRTSNLDRIRVLARHARRELLRGPLGALLTFRKRRLIQRLTFQSSASRTLWARLERLEVFGRDTRKLAFRALYNAPFGPGDAAAAPRVYRRQVELARRLRAMA